MRSLSRQDSPLAPSVAEGEERPNLPAMMNAAFDGIIALDDHGVVRSISAEAASLFGYAPGDVIGRDFGMLTPEANQRHHDYLRRGTPSIRRQIVGLRKDGSVFSVELVVSQVACDGERLFIALIHDLSSRRRLEQGVQELQAIALS